MRGQTVKEQKVINRIVFSVFGLLLAGSALAVSLTEGQRAAIEERIKPVGVICLEGDSSCAAIPAATIGVARSGEEVYNAACMACHTTGAAGAPVYGDVAGWSDRIAKGMAVLHDAGVNGVAGTGMIAKGGCMNCSDEEVIAAVDYMVEGSQ
ncbi:cytochrome c5 family protein [Halieaceae bacterium IMCC11814]|uniref:Cytochrome c5 family protein n=1 Tax=Candidatus Marimicrobium litorale TaxID=2518991 RepID=A0ABT3T6K0_9GAMM|nr:cytochrome c5 family protein [Candidatus Marimicrobium litorale]